MLNFQNVLPVHLPMTLDVLKNTFLIFCSTSFLPDCLLPQPELVSHYCSSGVSGLCSAHHNSTETAFPGDGESFPSKV